MNFSTFPWKTPTNYQAIDDTEANRISSSLEDNERDDNDVDDDDDSLSFSNSNSSNRKKKKNLFWLSLVLLKLSIILFFIIFTSSSLFNANLQQPGISRTTPFKVITHPDPPTPLWGTVTKPFPTGAFWTNLVVKNGDGPIGLYPYGVKTLDVGVQLSYGASRRMVSRTLINDMVMNDLQISSTQTYLSRAVESYDNVSVTMTYKVSNNGKYKAVLVKACPFVTVVYENATPLISSPLMKFLNVDAKVVKDGVGTQYLVTLGNYQKWLVYCSEPVALTWKENTLTASAPIKGFIRVAVLPLQNADNAFNTLLSYVSRYPTGGSVSVSYNGVSTSPSSAPAGNGAGGASGAGSSAVVTIQYSSVGTGGLLMLALPHHIPLLPSTLWDSDENKRVAAAYSPIYCIKGRLKAVVTDNLKLTYSLPNVGWHYNLADKLSTSQLDEMARNLIVEVRTNPPIPTSDAYAFGKQLGRMARLALIADYLGIADARQQAIYSLETSIIPWLQSMSQDVLLYDRTYGGLVTSGGIADQTNDFGSAWYSDHHFHYGYFLNTAAVLAKLDLPFFEANKNAFDTFLRDIVNPDPTDPDFPTVRHKDWFDGHSWASGLFPQGNGKGQESSSEAANAYYGAYLYALVTQNNDLQRFSLTLLAMEVQATQTYWHMSNDDMYDNVFSARRMLGNIGALDATTTTWFGGDIEMVHGINMMPLSPVSALLFDSQYAAIEYPTVAAHMPPFLQPGNQLCSSNPQCRPMGLSGNCCPTTEGVYLTCCDSYISTNSNRVSDEWKAYIYALLAVVDRETAWAQLDLLPGFGAGNSRTNSLMWAASRSPPLPGFNYNLYTNNSSFYRPSELAMPRASCAANSGCDALGLAGDCCPGADGLSLSCCGRTTIPTAAPTPSPSASPSP
eukprot:gene6287-6932_t